MDDADVKVSLMKFAPSRNPPKRTRCGNCDGKVSLRRGSWRFFSEQGLEYAAQDQQCGGCGHWVSCLVWRSERSH
jgi:hypothetical protein